MGLRVWVTARVGGALLGSTLASAFAATPAKAPAGPAPALVDEADPGKVQARLFFEKAKELYAAGRYREAAEQLEAALKRDPQGKDLVYNLALVRERLGEPEEAIVWVDRYLAMKLEPAERQRAEAFRRRLEGAREEIAEKRRKVVVVPVTVERERAVDAWVWAPASAAGAAAIAGAVLGSLALSTRPSGFVTGRDGTYDDLAARTSEAHGYAIGADVAWVTAAVGVGVAAWFYFGREPVPVTTRVAEVAP
jgi:tetratricopeptide (TPR) repeat protein